jgi:rhodanese-related sulfurtransferase
MSRLLFIFLFLIFSCSFLTPEINFISSSDLNELEEAEYILIDVRTTDEYQSGFIQNAINIDYYSEMFNSDILSFEKDSKIILYCRTNNRSAKSANLLLDNGYRDINVIEGGITSWVKSGNDIEYSIKD